MIPKKLGDKCRLLKNDNGYRIGEIVYLAEEDCRIPFVSFSHEKAIKRQGDGCVSLENLELIEDKPTPKFKIGDKVRVLRNDKKPSGIANNTKIGEIATLKQFGYNSEGNWWTIEERNCHDDYVYEDQIELIEDIPKPKFKIGDTVRVLRNEHCGNKVGYVGKITNGTMYSGERWWMFNTGLYNTESELELVREEECCNSCELNSGDIIKIDNEHGSGSIKNTTEKIMSKVSEFVKNSLLSKEEKLLRKYGLKDSCGDFTVEADRLVLSKLVKENEEYLVGVAKDLEAEEKANK